VGPAWPENKEDCATSSVELVIGTALSLPAELISRGKLQEADMPATRPLTYTQVEAEPVEALFDASHVYTCGGKIPSLVPLYIGYNDFNNLVMQTFDGCIIKF
jgi:hypothetical protein